MMIRKEETWGKEAMVQEQQEQMFQVQEVLPKE
jgi:hypothetical protein